MNMENNQHNNMNVQSEPVFNLKNQVAMVSRCLIDLNFRAFARMSLKVKSIAELNKYVTLIQATTKQKNDKNLSDHIEGSLKWAYII